MVNTLAFWQQVKEEKGNLNFQYLCHVSNTFARIWETSNRENIKVLANEFLNSNLHKDWLVDGEVLFVEKEIEFKNYRIEFRSYMEIRIDFINWCINKFSNETT